MIVPADFSFYVFLRQILGKLFGQEKKQTYVHIKSYFGRYCKGEMVKEGIVEVVVQIKRLIQQVLVDFWLDIKTKPLKCK